MRRRFNPQRLFTERGLEVVRGDESPVMWATHAGSPGSGVPSGTSSPNSRHPNTPSELSFAR